MSTRRCTQREFLLRPGPQANQIIGYTLGYTQERYRFGLGSFSAMSNHDHANISDCSSGPHSDLPNIMRDFNSMVARAINRLRGRKGNLWAAGGAATYNFVNSPTQADMHARCVYNITNPTAGGLVRTYKEWPGLLLTPGPSGRRAYRFKRPGIFFSKNMPEYTTVIVEAPKGELSPRDFMTSVFAAVSQREREIQADMRAEGRTFLGRKAVLRQDPTSRPNTVEPARSTHPKIGTSDCNLRKQMILDESAFLGDYVMCLNDFNAGSRDVQFPPGTFKMVAYYNARPRPTQSNPPPPT